MVSASERVIGSISIHVPREGHDLSRSIGAMRVREFLSTCPVRGTTADALPSARPSIISIHVPREGHDRVQAKLAAERRYFYPRAP